MTGSGVQPSRRTFAVDQVAGPIAILIDDAAVEVNVLKTLLPKGTVEGCVLRVPVLPDGRVEWPAAVLDEAERERRLQDARSRLERLRRRDPGGDVAL